LNKSQAIAVEPKLGAFSQRGVRDASNIAGEEEMEETLFLEQES